jgi:hypothetical protein
MHKPIVVLPIVFSGSVCHHSQSLHIPQFDVLITVFLSREETPPEMPCDLDFSALRSCLRFLLLCNVCASHTAR